MRLFIAINFNEDVIDDLVRLQAELKRCRAAVSLMRSERGKRGMIYTEIEGIDGDGKH